MKKHGGLVGSALKWGVGKPLVAAGGALTGLGLKAGGAAGGIVAENIIKHPLTMLGSGALIYANKDNIADVATGRRYQRIVAPATNKTPYDSDPSGQAGRRNDLFQRAGVEQMEKTFSVNLPSMGELEKLAFWGPALTGIFGGLVSPVMNTIGTKIQNKMFGTTGGAAALDEYSRQRAKTLAKLEAVNQLQAAELERTRKQVAPQMVAMYNVLKKEDKDIGAAAKDTQLQSVMHHTMNTVSTFAPSIATDPRALQSVLREAISSPEGGLSFQTIKHLSETQKFINESRSKKWAE